MDLSQQNYLRIVAIVNGPGLNAVRCYFDKCFPPTLLNIQLSSVLRQKLETLKKKKVLSDTQWDILFPTNGSSSSALYDVALMTLLLRHFHIKKEPIGGYDKLPVDQDQSPAADLARIKYYRNVIAHSKDGSINHDNYKKTWKTLCEVVNRLGDDNLKKECELLGRADLNMAYKSQCDELSRNITILKEHDAALESRQDQLASDLIKQGDISSKIEDIIETIVTDLKIKHGETVRILDERINNLHIQLDGMSKLLYSQQSTIPRNVKAKIVRQIKKWIEDEKKYVVIASVGDVLDLLRKHSSLTVVGNAGCGKTAFIRHLALRLMSDGYEIVPVIEPKTIVEYHDETKKQVFVLDDACGVHTVNRQKRMAWLDYSQVIQDCLLQSSSVLLVSVRLSIFNNELFQDMKLLSHNIINFKEEKYALTFKNRQAIFRSYFDRGHEELGITNKSLLMHDAFPLLCRFSSRSLQTVADEEIAPLVTKSENDLNDLDTFFQTPIQVIESEIKSMRIDSPVSYCVLVLCLLFNGKLPKHDIFFSNKYKSLLKDCYSVCGLNRGTPIKTLSDIAKSLTGVYLNEVDGTLIFIHDIIMDTVSVCFGEHFPNILLKYADIELIINRVQLKSNDSTKATGYRIFIDKDHHVDFFHRFCTEIEKGNACQVFNHGQLEVQWFQKALTKYLEKRSDDELRYTFFQVKDKEGDRHQKLRLKLIDVWIEIIDQKPAKIDVHSFLDLIVINAFQWLLGKGLFDIIMLLERRLCSDVHNEVSSNADSSSKFIAILGGNVKTYSWICQVQKGMLWQYVSNTLFINKYCIQDFQWALIAGQTNIVEFLLNNEICKNCINESITVYDMNLIGAKLFGLSDYTTRIISFWLKYAPKHFFKFNFNSENIEYNLENVINLVEMTIRLFYTEDKRFNKLIYKKFKSDIKPIVTKTYQQRVELQCSKFPLPKNITEYLYGSMKDRKTYLAYASILGHESIVDLLLRKGANPNEISLRSNNIAKSSTVLPVVYASMYGRLQILQRLLKNGAEIESTGPKGCTLLMFASSYGHYDVAKFLLNENVDINATNMFQNTALLYASKKGHTNIVHLLLENGAIPNAVCYKSSTPLIEAASRGHFEIVGTLLFHNSTVNACDNKNMTALTKAAENGHYTIVEQLVAKQAALSIRTHQDETALMIACRKGHFNVVSILIKCLNECINNRYISKDSECFSLENENWITFKQLPYAFCSLPVTFTNDERNQAFLNAYHNKHIDIMKLLLDNGATVNLLLNNGKNYKLTQFRKSLTLLNVAVLNREYEIVNILLNNGAQVQKRANYGIPPLMLASRSCTKHINIVKILLKHGSNINSTSEYIPIYITLLEYIWIRQNSNKSKIIRICENPDKNGTALICAVQSSSLELIKALVQERNININSQTSMGRTALMIACGTVGREKTVDLLLQCNAEVNIRSKLGATALDIASMHVEGFRNENIIRALQRNGAIHSRDMIPFPDGYQVRPLRYLDPQIELGWIWTILRILVILGLSTLVPLCE